MPGLGKIVLVIAAGLMFENVLAQPNPPSGRESQSLGFYEANLGLVKKMITSNCHDATSAAACMVRSIPECVALMNAAFDICWPSLKPNAPKVAGPEALKFNTQIAACVFPQFKQLVAQSDARVENYKVPCRETIQRANPSFQGTLRDEAAQRP